MFLSGNHINAMFVCTLQAFRELMMEMVRVPKHIETVQKEPPFIFSHKNEKKAVWAMMVFPTQDTLISLLAKQRRKKSSSSFFFNPVDFIPSRRILCEISTIIICNLTFFPSNFLLRVCGSQRCAMQRMAAITGCMRWWIIRFKVFIKINDVWMVIWLRFHSLWSHTPIVPCECVQFGWAVHLPVALLIWPRIGQELWDVDCYLWFQLEECSDDSTIHKWIYFAGSFKQKCLKRNTSRKQRRRCTVHAQRIGVSYLRVWCDFSSDLDISKVLRINVSPWHFAGEHSPHRIDAEISWQRTKNRASKSIIKLEVKCLPVCVCAVSGRRSICSTSSMILLLCACDLVNIYHPINIWLLFSLWTFILQIAINELTGRAR